MSGRYEYYKNRVRIYYPQSGNPVNDVLVEAEVETTSGDKAWKTVARFNPMSDDYAYTNAKEYAKKIERARYENV